MSQLLEPPLSSPFQEAEVISGKTDNDGHHYLKVLLLSNKMTGNKWIAPYDRIGNLPKQLLDSFVGLPYVGEHNYELYDRLDKIMYGSGLSDDQIINKLKEECSKEGIKKGYIDHVFMDDPNSSLLYGQLKITDPKENEYIRLHGNPSFKYTSPAITGYYEEDNHGNTIYDVNKIMAFHVASVPVPAFSPSEAKVRGVCSGNSDSCKRKLAVAGIDTTASSTPTENLNSTCGCNKNIQDMSTNQQSQPAVTTVSTTPGSVAAEVSVTPAAQTGNLLKDSQSTTAEAIKAAREEAQKVVKELSEPNNQKQPKEENKEDDDEEQQSNLKAELRKYKQLAEEERKRNLDQYNFILDEVLSVHIPQSHFRKVEDFEAEKESMKSFINKYNVNLQDAKWLIIKSAKGIPNQNEEQTTSKKEGKHGVGVAGLLSTTYTSDIVTRPTTAPKPAGNSSLEDDDFPLGIE